MNKFEQQRAQIQKEMDEKLARIEEAEKQHQRKIVKPLASKFSALMAEEVEKFGFDNLLVVEDYKFKKPELREKIREFISKEFEAGGS